MQIWQIFILIFCGICVFNALIFIIYSFIADSQQAYKSIFIQFILIAFILQITGTMPMLFELNYPFIVHNMYVVGILVQGPIMYLFLKKSLSPQLKIWPKQFIIHILPYLIFNIQKFNFPDIGVRERIFLILAPIQILVYTLLCIRLYLDVRRLYLNKQKQYYLLYHLYPFFAILWMVFPLAGLTKVNDLVYESIFYSLFIYYLLFLKIKEPKLETDKYKSTGINNSQSLDIYKKVIQKIKENKYHLDPNLTLTLLAKKVYVPVNVLSQVINQNAHSNFRDFINSFRIEEAQIQIDLKVKKGFTIASVAYDCGFNSLSAFNRAFKKVAGQTPSEYIKSIN